jgi:hypothetical protein
VTAPAAINHSGPDSNSISDHLAAGHVSSAAAEASVRPGLGLVLLIGLGFQVFEDVLYVYNGATKTHGVNQFGSAPQMFLYRGAPGPATSSPPKSTPAPSTTPCSTPSAACARSARPTANTYANPADPTQRSDAVVDAESLARLRRKFQLGATRRSPSQSARQDHPTAAIQPSEPPDQLRDGYLLKVRKQSGNLMERVMFIVPPNAPI